MLAHKCAGRRAASLAAGVHAGDPRPGAAHQCALHRWLAPDRRSLPSANARVLYAGCSLGSPPSANAPRTPNPVPALCLGSRRDLPCVHSTQFAAPYENHPNGVRVIPARIRPPGEWFAQVPTGPQCALHHRSSTDMLSRRARPWALCLHTSVLRTPGYICVRGARGPEGRCT